MAASSESQAEGDNDMPEEVNDSLEGFYGSMDAVEESLEPIFCTSSENIQEKLNVLDCAKLDLMTVYAINSLVRIYLIIQGISPKEHGITHELDRIKNYMGKIREISDKKKALLKINKDAAKRFVRNALSNVSGTKSDESTLKKVKRKKEMLSGGRKKHKAD